MKETVNPYSLSETEDDHSSLIEKYISRADVVLGCKGHLGIINMLRSDGYSVDDAKRLSYPLFDEAFRRIMREQLPLIILARVFFFLGGILPFILLIYNGNLYPILFGLLIVGFMIRQKIIRPSRIPLTWK